MNARTNMSSPEASLARLIAQAKIGELALAHHQAVRAANSAKHDYHDAIRDFEGEKYCYEERTHPGEPGWDALTEATATEFAAYRAAQRVAYNIKRRLENACRKFN